MSVRLCVRLAAWDNTALTGGISMEFDIRWFFEKCVEKLKDSLISDKNNGWFTWRRKYIYDVYVVQLDTQYSFMVEFIHNIYQLYSV
jgi:hypothetical protein